MRAELGYLSWICYVWSKVRVSDEGWQNLNLRRISENSIPVGQTWQWTCPSNTGPWTCGGHQGECVLWCWIQGADVHTLGHPSCLPDWLPGGGWPDLKSSFWRLLNPSVLLHLSIQEHQPVFLFPFLSSFFPFFPSSFSPSCLLLSLFLFLSLSLLHSLSPSLLLYLYLPCLPLFLSFSLSFCC